MDNCSTCGRSVDSSPCPCCQNEQFCDFCNQCNICGPIITDAVAERRARAILERDALTYHIIAVSKFRYRVVKQGHSLPLRGGIAVFEFVSEPMAEREALDHAQYMNTGVKPERRAQ